VRPRIAAAGVAYAVQAMAEHQPHAARDLGVRDLDAGPELPIVVEELAGLDQVAEQLFDEERIPLRLEVDERDQLGRRALAGARLDQGGRAGLVEAAQHHLLDPGIAQQLGERGAQRATGLELGMAIGAEHQDGHLADALGQMAEQQQGRFVGQVQILEDEDLRLGARRPLDERRYAVQQVAPLLLRRQPDRFGDVVIALSQLRHQRVDLRRVLADEDPVLAIEQRHAEDRACSRRCRPSPSR
jgi:hypothetical protein